MRRRNFISALVAPFVPRAPAPAVIRITQAQVNRAAAAGVSIVLRTGCRYVVRNLYLIAPIFVEDGALLVGG